MEDACLDLEDFNKLAADPASRSTRLLLTRERIESPCRRHPSRERFDLSEIAGASDEEFYMLPLLSRL